MRAHTHIPVKLFDGSIIPFDDRSFDAILFSDVLHRTNDPQVLLKEAHRVASKWVLVKDHYRKGLAAAQQFAVHGLGRECEIGVALPYNYWSEGDWRGAWQELGFQLEELVTQLRLYPAPASWLFGADLHFIGRLKKL